MAPSPASSTRGAAVPALRGPIASARHLLGALAWTAALAALAAAIALLEPEHLAIAVAGTVAGALILLRPLVGVALVLVAVPFGSLAQVEAGDFSISAMEPLVALVGLAWLLDGVRQQRIAIRGGMLLAPIVAMLALQAFSITYAVALGPAIKETLKWAQLLVVLLVVADLARTPARLRWLLAALFLAGALEALWGVFQVARGSGPTTFAVAGALRAYGHFEQPNPFAGYLATILPPAVAMAAERSNGLRFRLLAGGAALLLALGIALSQSRGAWLGVAAAFTVMLLAWSHRTRLWLVPAAAAALFLVLLALAGFLPASLVDRFAQTVGYFGIFDVRTVEPTAENWAVVERMAHWQAGWLMFLDHPWLGVGAGNYAETYPDYYLADWLDPLGHAHNYYLNTLAELGLLGLTLLLTLLATVFTLLLSSSSTRSLRGETSSAPQAGPKPPSPPPPPVREPSSPPPLPTGPRLSPALPRERGPGGVGTPPSFYSPSPRGERGLGGEGLPHAILVGILGALVVFCTHNLFDNLFVHGVNAQLGFLLGIAWVAARSLHRPPAHAMVWRRDH